MKVVKMVVVSLEKPSFWHSFFTGTKLQLCQLFKVACLFYFEHTVSAYAYSVLFSDVYHMDDIDHVPDDA